MTKETAIQNLLLDILQYFHKKDVLNTEERQLLKRCENVLCQYKGFLVEELDGVIAKESLLHASISLDDCAKDDIGNIQPEGRGCTREV